MSHRKDISVQHVVTVNEVLTHNTRREPPPLCSDWFSLNIQYRSRSSAAKCLEMLAIWVMGLLGMRRFVTIKFCHKFSCRLYGFVKISGFLLMSIINIEQLFQEFNVNFLRLLHLPTATQVFTHNYSIKVNMNKSDDIAVNHNRQRYQKQKLFLSR